MTKQELMAKIATIKNATAKGENTAMRVGGAMEDMVNFTDEQIEQLKADADNGDVLKIYIDLSWVVEGVYNDTFPTPTEDDPYVLSPSEIEQTFGMSKELLINKVFNAKHNIAFVSGACETPGSDIPVVLKLNTISAFKGMIANGGTMVQLTCPFAIDMLGEGSRGVIRIQSTSPNTKEVVFVLLHNFPSFYKEVIWDGRSSISTSDGSIVNVVLDSPKSLLYFPDISKDIMMFGKFHVSSDFSVSIQTEKGSTTISEVGDYQFSCIFGNVTTQKLY